MAAPAMEANSDLSTSANVANGSGESVADLMTAGIGRQRRGGKPKRKPPQSSSQPVVQDAPVVQAMINERVPPRQRLHDATACI